MLEYSIYKPYVKENIKLSLPIIAGQLGQVSVNIIDNLMVGRLGAEALAAIAVANSIFIVFLVIGMGLSFALPPLISSVIGADRKDKISSLTRHSMYINVAFGAVVTFIMLLGIPIVDHLGQDPEVVVLAKPYLIISAYSMVPFMVFQTMRCYSDGWSDTLSPTIAILIGNVVNVVLNYIFIFGKFGFEPMGVTGAAWGTFLSRVVMLAVLSILLYKKDEMWKYFGVFVRNYSWPKIKELLHLGIPISLQMFFEIMAFSGASLIMGLISKEAQAAHQISINLASVTFLICSGVAMAGTILVSKYFGNQNMEKTRIAGLAAIYEVVVLMFGFALAFIFLRHFLPTLYIDDVEVVSIASVLLIYAAIFQIPDGVQVTALGILRGLQDVNVPTAVTFVAYGLVGLPISYILAIHTPVGGPGVWVGLFIGLSISASVLTFRFIRKTKIGVG